MSDEQEPRRDPSGPPPGGDPDQTRAAGNHPDDGPRSDDAWVTDGTQQMPRTPPADDDATVLTPRQDDTSVLPPVRDWADQDAAWAGRAEVRPPRPGQADYGTGSDWDAVPPPGEPRGKWWMPILVGTLALILLGLLGWGIYLITRDTEGADETPAPAVSAPAPAVTTVPTSTAPTTTPPTTTPPTTETTNPPDVVVPALVGLSRQDAEQALRLRGLKFRSITEPSDSRAGTVIDSDPAEGQEVPADTQVTLVIAAARPSPSPSVSVSSSPTAGQPDDD